MTVTMVARALDHALRLTRRAGPQRLLDHRRGGERPYDLFLLTSETSGVPAEHELGCIESQTVTNSATCSVLKSTDYCECPGWEPPGRPQRELMRMAH